MPLTLTLLADYCRSPGTGFNKPPCKRILYTALAIQKSLHCNDINPQLIKKTPS